MATASRRPAEALTGLLVLIVEDEMLLAMALEDLVRDLGCDVVTAARVARALELVATTALDGAILDVNLHGEMVFPVAHALRQRGIPFVFSSGYGAGGLPPAFHAIPMLTKPFDENELAPLLEETFGVARKG